MSCNARRRRQRKEPTKSVCLHIISKKTTLNVQQTFSFFVYFFPVVLHDQNVKLPETSLLHVLQRKCYMRFCSLFSLPLICTLVAASISHFLTAVIKFSFFYSNKIGLLCSFFFISRTTSLSVIYVNLGPVYMEVRDSRQVR